jgi:hypothetical protein
MTDVNPPQLPPSEPPGTPTTWPGPPGAPQPPPWAAPNQWSQPYAPYPPRRTNGLAITALILGLVPILFWPLALFLGIAAVITGHIGRGQIRRAKSEGRDEQGAGMALAGLILGYVWIVLSILGAIALVLFLTLGIPAITQVSVRNDARNFGRDAVTRAESLETTPRNPAVVQDVYRQRYLYSNNSDTNRAHLADGTSLAVVTERDLARNDYRIEFSQNTIGTKYACLTLPATVSGPLVVHDGRC